MTPKDTRTDMVLPVLVLALLLADMNLMAPNLSAIGHEFGLGRAEIDRKLGADLNLMFWLLGGTLTLLVGYWTDRADLRTKLPRKNLLLALAVIGQSACLLSGLSRTYSQLYWARVLTGIGVGGCGPVVYSLLGDQIAPARRARVVALVNVSANVAIALGQLLAGLLGPRYGWRLPFLIVAPVGLLLSAGYAVWGREPERGRQEVGLQALHAAGLAYQERSRLRELPLLLRLRTNFTVVGSALLSAVP